jgi:hypothetical protein
VCFASSNFSWDTTCFGRGLALGDLTLRDLHEDVHRRLRERDAFLRRRLRRRRLRLRLGGSPSPRIVNLALQVFRARCLRGGGVHERLLNDFVDALAGRRRARTLRHDLVLEPRHEIGLDLALHGVVKKSRVVQLVEHVPEKPGRVPARERLRRNLLPRGFLALDALLLLRDAALALLGFAPLRRLHALRRDELRVADLLEVLLVRAHRRELLLLHNLHQALLERLPHEHLQDGLHLEVEVEQVAVLDLRLDVHADLHRDEQRRRRAIRERVRLRHHLSLGHGVRELLQVRLGLDVHVPAPLDRLGRAGDAPARRGARFQARALRRRRRRNGLRRVRVPADHAPVEHDVRGVVLRLGRRLGTELGLCRVRNRENNGERTGQRRACLTRHDENRSGESVALIRHDRVGRTRDVPASATRASRAQRRYATHRVSCGQPRPPLLLP